MERRIHPDVLPPIDSELEARWQRALLSRPDGGAALTAWNDEHAQLLTDYQQATEEALTKQREQTKAEAAQVEQARTATAQARRRRWRLRRKWAGSLTILALASSAGVYWYNQPSEDETRLAEFLQREQVCAAQYEQAYGLTLVTRQVDLLKDGEGGWVDLSPPPGESPVVGGVDVFPADLVAGKTGEATVDREGLVYESGSSGRWALIERQNGSLYLLLFYSPSGFGSELPHAPLRAPGILPAEVRAAPSRSGC